MATGSGQWPRAKHLDSGEQPGPLGGAPFGWQIHLAPSGFERQLLVEVAKRGRRCGGAAQQWSGRAASAR